VRYWNRVDPLAVTCEARDRSSCRRTCRPCTQVRLGARAH
jgi:hypothetical protein